ncbi:MAG: C39 family peptidase [Bilifractor sp.]
MEKKFRTVMILLLTAVFISGSIPVFAQSQSVDAAEFAGGVQNVTGQTENTAETGGMYGASAATESGEAGRVTETARITDATGANTGSKDETGVETDDGKINSTSGEVNSGTGYSSAGEAGAGTGNGISGNTDSDADGNASGEAVAEENVSDENVSDSSDKKEDAGSIISDSNEKKNLSGVHVYYSAHVQRNGWTNEVSDGAKAGTEGQSLRMEAVRISLKGDTDLHVDYSAHVQRKGWMQEVSDGEMAGTNGQSLRMEAFRLHLTGPDADKYSIYYRVHVQKLGWLGWAKNGETAGTTGLSLRLESIQIMILPNDNAGISDTDTMPSDIETTLSDTGAISVPYVYASAWVRSHMQRFGWQNWKNGEGGITGQGLRLEALQIKSDSSISGEIEYQAHVQGIGWEKNWAADGTESGTEGKKLRLEAVRIRLTGELAKYFDIYYRVHIQSYGWLGWTKNGADAGSTGCSYRIEALQVQLKLKGSSAPGSMANAYIKDQVHLNVPCVMQNPELPTGCESVALTNLLKYHGFSLSKTTIADHYMPYGTNIAINFVGNPHNSNGAGIYPPGIVITANKYLQEKKSPLRAYDITGSSMDQLYRYLKQGYPVLVWGTIYMETPHVIGYYVYRDKKYPWYREEHCMVLKGCNYRTGEVEVSDSISGNVVRNAARFTSIYDQIGRYAVVIW